MFREKFPVQASSLTHIDGVTQVINSGSDYLYLNPLVGIEHSERIDIPFTSRTISIKNNGSKSILAALGSDNSIGDVLISQYGIHSDVFEQDADEWTLTGTWSPITNAEVWAASLSVTLNNNAIFDPGSDYVTEITVGVIKIDSGGICNVFVSDDGGDNWTTPMAAGAGRTDGALVAAMNVIDSYDVDSTGIEASYTYYFPEASSWTIKLVVTALKNVSSSAYGLRINSGQFEFESQEDGKTIEIKTTKELVVNIATETIKLRSVEGTNDVEVFILSV